MRRLLAVVALAVVGRADGSETKEEVELELGVMSNLTSLGDGESAYFFARIPENATGQEYLIFDVLDKPPGESDPDIYISSTTARPELKDGEWKCRALGQDICVVPREQVKPNKVFHATVFCEQKCNFTIHAQTRAMISILDGIWLKDRLKADETKLFSFTLPKQQKDVTSFSVTLSVDTPETTKVKMYVAKAGDETVTPTSENSLRVVPSWQGLTARVYESDEGWFQQGCLYKVLISSQVGTGYSLMYRTSKNVVDIKEAYAEVFDVVAGEMKNCYKYNVRSEEDNLELYIYPYSGNPDLYVNPGEVPNDLANAAFKSTGDNMEIMTITPKERAAKGALKGKYYICVYGTTTSSYNLMLMMVSPSEVRQMSIACGMTRTMNVDKGKLILFEHKLEAQASTNLSFSLNSITGNADLFIKFCSVEQTRRRPTKKCTLTESELDDPNVLKSVNQTGIDSIAITYSPSSCPTGNQCTFVVGVLGVKRSSFSLSLVCSSGQAVALQEGSPFYGMVEAHSSQYFLFTIDNPETSVVKIQLTSMSGDADLLVSRHSPFCQSHTAEKISNRESYSPDTVIFTKDGDGYLNSTYYVTVEGFTYAMFSLVYTSTVAQQTTRSIRLSEGFPLIGSLNQSQEALYQARVTAPNDGDNPGLRIILIPISGSFEMFVGADYVPTRANHTWRTGSSETALRILPADPHYRRTARYFIRVEKADKDDVTPHIFTVKYVVGRGITNLIEGFLEIGNITHGVDQHYVYHASGDKDIIVTVTPLVNDPDLYISVSKNNRFPSSSQYDVYSANLGADTILVPMSLMRMKNPECKPGSAPQCPIYIAVSCSQEDCSYTIQVTQNTEKPLRLSEGIPQHGNVSEDSVQLFELYPNTTAQNVEIYVSPRVGKVKAYALVLPAGARVNKTNAPSASNKDVASVDRANTQYLLINRRVAARKCRGMCKYVMGVYCDADGYMPGEPLYSEFSITAVRWFMRLRNGQAVVGSVFTEQYSYYRFRTTCTDCVLSISLTPLSDGDPDLYIMKGASALPNRELFHFSSSSYRGEYLEISSDHEYFKKSGESIRGDYVIAVYGVENCTYNLLASVKSVRAKVEPVALTPGVPLRHEQAERKLEFFEFAAQKRADIRISLAVHYGRGVIRAVAIKRQDFGNLQNLLPVNESSSTWSTERENTFNSLTISTNHPQFITSGKYVISVESAGQMKYDITAEYMTETDVTVLKNGETYRGKLQPTQSHTFSYVASSNTDLMIRLFGLKGVVEAKLIRQSDQQQTIIVTNAAMVLRTSDPLFELGTYYIRVAAPDNAEFALTVEQRVRMVTLHEGQPHRDSIDPREPKYFLYHIPPRRTGETLKYNVFASFLTPITDARIYIRRITRADKANPNENNSEHIVKYDPMVKRLGDSFSVESSQSQATAIGLYVNDTEDGQPVRFDLTCWSTGVIQMNSGQQYVNSFEVEQQTHSYELSTKKGERVHVEVVPCVGEVEFFVASALSRMDDRGAAIAESKMDKGRLFGSFDAMHDQYFISVKGCRMGTHGMDQRKREIVYTVRTIVSAEREFDKVEDYILDNFGKIDYNVKGDEVELKWGQVLERSASRSVVSRVKYSVYMAEHGEGQMYTACSIKYSNATEIASRITATRFVHKLGPEMPGKKWVFNVLAVVPQHNQLLAYTPVDIQVVHSSGHLWIYLLVLIGGVLILSIALCIYCRKYKDTKRQLDYEMTDARNMASVSSKPKYSHLTGQVQESIQDQS